MNVLFVCGSTRSMRLKNGERMNIKHEVIIKEYEYWDTLRKYGDVYNKEDGSCGKEGHLQQWY